MPQAIAVLMMTIPGGPLPVEVSTPLPAGVTEDAPMWSLERADGGPLKAQRVSIGPWAEDGTQLCFIVPPTDDDRDDQYSLSRLHVWAEEGVFEFSEREDTYLDLAVAGGGSVLTYNYGMILADGVPEDRRRSSYVHPLHGLDGEEVTGDFPKDHYHHRGVSWTWPKVIVDGKIHDLWAIGTVKAKFERWLGREAGPVCAVFGVENGWYVGEECIVKEQVWFRAWRAGEFGRAIDAHLTFTAQEKPVGLRGADGKGYGGFGLRVPVVPGKTVTKPDGTTVVSSNEEKLPWADMSAELAGEGKVSGASIFIDAANPGFPNGWCLREYGYLGVHWPGLETVTLQPGEPVSMTYRVWVHRGDVTEGKSAEAYEAFAHPVEVTVEEPED